MPPAPAWGCLIDNSGAQLIASQLYFQINLINLQEIEEAESLHHLLDLIFLGK